MHKTIYKRSNSGFTLIEIMIVVAILGLISAIAVPNFLKVKAMAEKNACVANLKRVSDAKTIWALDEGKIGTDTPVWSDLVPDYVRKRPACPAGGTYSINNVETEPTCSISGHELI